MDVFKNIDGYTLLLSKDEVLRLGSFLQANDVGERDKTLYTEVYVPLTQEMNYDWGEHTVQFRDKRHHGRTKLEPLDILPTEV